MDIISEYKTKSKELTMFISDFEKQCLKTILSINEIEPKALELNEDVDILLGNNGYYEVDVASVQKVIISNGIIYCKTKITNIKFNELIWEDMQNVVDTIILNFEYHQKCK